VKALLQVRLKVVGGLCAAALLQGCATAMKDGDDARQPAVMITGIEIRNELAYPVTDVLIEVPASGAFAGCGNLLPRTACSNAFEGVDYRSSAVVIRWRERGQDHSTGEFVIEIPADMQPDRPALVEVLIFAPGEAGARLVQR
jgi:hypothetical protein